MFVRGAEVIATTSKRSVLHRPLSEASVLPQICASHQKRYQKPNEVAPKGVSSHKFA